MSKNLARLREEVAKHEGGRGNRYPAALQREAIRYARSRREEGASWATIAGEVGLRFETLRRWCLRESEVAMASIVPVEVDAREAVGSEVVIVSPSGFRLEGLDAASAVAALRALR